MGSASVEKTLGEKRLAAIMFTDVVDFGGRVQADEATALRLVQRDLKFISDACARAGGSVLKNTGDGLLVSFDSADNAVACAVSVQKAMWRASAKLPPNQLLQHRIGIHLGDVFITADDDVLGNGVNIAARILQEAEPGSICISQTVFDVVKHRLGVKAHFLGRKDLKNIRDAVPVYKLLVRAEEQALAGLAQHGEVSDTPSAAASTAAAAAAGLIEAACRGCGARYRIKPNMAGRMAECRQCGQKFRVPYRSAVVRLDDPAIAEPAAAALPPPTAAEQPPPAPIAPAGPAVAPQDEVDEGDAVEIPLKLDTTRKPPPQPDGEAAQLVVSGIVADLWLPLGLATVGYGAALAIAFGYVARSPGPAAGIILVTIAGLLYFLGVLPMTTRMVDGASETFEIQLPNAFRLQTAGTFAVPTLVTTIGLFLLGPWGALVGGILGLAATGPLLALHYRIDLRKAWQVAGLAGLGYGGSMLGTAGVVAFIGLLLMPLWETRVPWEGRAKLMAASDQQNAPPPQVAPKSAPATSPSTSTANPPAFDPARTTPPIAQRSVEPVAQRPHSVILAWAAAVDPPPAPPAWPTEVQLLVDVRSSASVVYSGGPFVAICDQDSTDVYDLRRRGTKSLVGTLAGRYNASGAVLSHDGKYMAQRRAPRDGIEVWSTAGNQIVRLASDAATTGRGFPMPWEFMRAGDRLVTRSNNDLVQVWDLATAQAVATINDPDATQAGAISPGGKFCVLVTHNLLRVYDLRSGRRLGETVIEQRLRPQKIAYSPDGRWLAGIAYDMGSSLRLVVWDAADGKLVTNEPVDGPYRGSAGGVRWLPDSSAMLIGNELHDRATGRAYFTLPDPPAIVGNGQPAAMLSPYHVLYEYAHGYGSPPRVLLKSQSLDAARVAEARQRLAPAGAPVTPAATQPGAAPSSPASSQPQQQPAPQPAPKRTIAQWVLEKEWDVVIQSVSRSDASLVLGQLAQAEARLRSATTHARDTRARADTLARDKEKVEFTNSLGQKQTSYKDNPGLADAKRTAGDAASELGAAKREVAKLQKERDNAVNNRTLRGRLEDGTPVELFIAARSSTDPILPKLDGLVPGLAHRVRGSAEPSKDQLKIRVQDIQLP